MLFSKQTEVHGIGTYGLAKEYETHQLGTLEYKQE